jgi:Amt family ammonium transporter
MESTINPGDTAWILVATALVLMMTPALGFFYGGMVRKKNILSTLNLSFIVMGLISVQWLLWGYTVSFGSSLGGVIGGLNYAGFMGVGEAPNPTYAATIPHLAFAAYQMMFAVITPALITGAFVERVRFKTFLVFTLLWATLVYNPVAHWVWAATDLGNGEMVFGWLRGLGALDFAGERWCISPPDFRPWLLRWSSESGAGLAPAPSSRTTSPLLCWGRACCGWVGLASTAAAPWRPMVWP